MRISCFTHGSGTGGFPVFSAARPSCRIQSASIAFLHSASVHLGSRPAAGRHAGASARTTLAAIIAKTKPERPAGAVRWKGYQPNKVWTSRVMKAPVDAVWGVMRDFAGIVENAIALRMHTVKAEVLAEKNKLLANEFNHRAKNLLAVVRSVADDVVVHEKHGTPPAQMVKTVQFGNDLFCGFGAGPVPEQSRHVAELAVEGAAPGELEAHGGIVFQIHQLPHGGGSFSNVTKLGGFIERLGATLFQLFQKRGKGQFSFIEHKMVHIRELIVLAGEERPSCDDLEARTLAAGNDFTGRFSLHNHGADEGAQGLRDRSQY